MSLSGPEDQNTLWWVSTSSTSHSLDIDQSQVAYKDAVYVFGGDNGRSMLNDLLR